LKENFTDTNVKCNSKKIGENQYQIDADSNLGMKVPVRIYADEALMQKM